ncbi:MAG: DUF86 domain-containing protein [Anaerolineae bacterium]|jgi:uncharacterized protein with HEPN domain|nr:DUF86 domain-containing protein [Anaerolineae bacterium]
MKNQKRLRDILVAVESIESYAIDNYETFLADHKTQDAILYNLIIIGEAANQISDDFQNQYHLIPWSSMMEREISLCMVTIKSSCKLFGKSFNAIWIR